MSLLRLDHEAALQRLYEEVEREPSPFERAHGHITHILQEEKEMAQYEIPKTSFEPHPEGEHTGTIVEVVDQGLRETRYGTKHKLTAIIESDTAIQDSGEPFALWVWFTLSSGPKSTLVQLRQKLLRRALTEEERTHFDSAEMVGKRVKYLVAHNFGDDGQVFANLVTWSSLAQGQAARQAREQLQAGQAAQVVPNEPQGAEAERVRAGEEDDLPF